MQHAVGGDDEHFPGAQAQSSPCAGVEHANRQLVVGVVELEQARFVQRQALHELVGEAQHAQLAVVVDFHRGAAGLGFIVGVELAKGHRHRSQHVEHRRPFQTQAFQHGKAVDNAGFAASAVVGQHVQRLHARRPGVAHHVVVRRHVLGGVRDVVAGRIHFDVVNALEQHLAHGP